MRPLLVAAAIIERDGHLLVTRRQAGMHLAGLWEFPGGKCEPGETLHACLRRELEEELGVLAAVGREVFSASHTYPDRVVELHFLECQFSGQPEARLGQEIRWVTRAELRELEFPPADAELIQWLATAAEGGSDTTTAGDPPIET